MSSEARMQMLARRETERLAERLRLSRERAAGKALAEGVAETIALSEARGERFTPPARNGGVRRRKDGLDWLYEKGRISHRQKLAGEKYGDDWRKSQAASPRSCLDPTVRGYHDGTPAEARTHAALRLARARAGADGRNWPEPSGLWNCWRSIISAEKDDAPRGAPRGVFTWSFRLAALSASPVHKIARIQPRS